jgi:ribosome biogenesis GTPase
VEGLVIKNTGSWYTVKTDDGAVVECKIKGNFRLKGIRSTNPVAVGDHVKLIMNNEGTAFISEIEERRNYIIRKSINLSKQSHIIAANIDEAFLIVTVSHPETSTTFIDRFLASAEAYSIPVTLLFNKLDILTPEELHYQDMLITLYENIGYRCLTMSALTMKGLDKTSNSEISASDMLKPLLENKISLFSGNSGVGKSTIINKIFGCDIQRTEDISDAHNTGLHTTTFSEMFALPYGGYIIDTPGIKGFGSFDMEKEEISSYFKEIFEFSKDCRFNNCTHTHEPGCAVIKAVNEHYIAESRYTSYLSMLEDKDENKYREAF